MKRRRWLVVAIVVALVLVAAVAAARPGGGGNYSAPTPRPSPSPRPSSGGGGGGSNGGGGGGGDITDLLEILVWLWFEHPVIGIPLTIAFVIFVLVRWLRQGEDSDWSSGVSAASTSWSPKKKKRERTFEEYTPPPPPTPPSLDPIRELDPNFSRVIFEDFIYSLYAEVHLARGRNQLNRLSAYLAPNTMVELQQRTRGPVDSVIVGAVRYLEVSASATTGARVVVELESNYTEAGRGYYVRERWTLARRPTAKSRTPDRVRQLGCPNCGAPQDALFSGTCRSCGRVVNDGSFDWSVQGVSEMEREQRPPVLTSNVEEQGTSDPTIRDPYLPQALQRLRQKDPAFDVAQFNARVGLIFQQFQIGWSSRDLTKMRPFMSDALFTTQQYWIQAYLAQHLRNMTDGARITNIEIAKAVSDAYYDAITVRLHATSLDYTIADDGRVVSGSKSRPRAYTEYWTLIRGTNRKGPTRTDLACSNCGAPLDVNMVGTCKYCNVKVTTGDFDWVLSRIEQDESYTG